MEDPSFRYFVEPYIIDIDREIDDLYFENLGQTKSGDHPSFSFESIHHGRKTIRDKFHIERFRALIPGGRKSIPKGGENTLSVEITPTRAYHKDYTYSDSFGFVIDLKDASRRIVFGYTGDTKWIYDSISDPFSEPPPKGPLDNNNKNGRSLIDIMEQYKTCDVIVVHLGSLIDIEKDKAFGDYSQCCISEERTYECEELVRDKNHPYLIGLIRLLSNLYQHLRNEWQNNPDSKLRSKPLVLLGEFGEELRGNIRIDLAERLNQVYRNQFEILPLDVGINIQLCGAVSHPADDRKKTEGHLDLDNSEGLHQRKECNCTVWCVQCGKFVTISEATFKLCGQDNALYCVCRTCIKSTPEDVLLSRLRQLYETGIEVRVLPEG